MTKDEALKMAAEALERSVATCFDQYSHQQLMSHPNHFINQAITAIKEALAQPEQQAEPPEWPLIKNILDEYGLDAIAFVAEWKAAQRPWVGLTDDEIRALASWWPSYDQMPALMVLAKKIQENLKERNNG